MDEVKSALRIAAAERTTAQKIVAFHRAMARHYSKEGLSTLEWRLLQRNKHEQIASAVERAGEGE